MNKPFLKWAGNKFKVLPFILPLIGNPKRYCEPFGGSLSVALNVDASQYILGDINADLIAIYITLMSAESAAFISSCEELFAPENNQATRFYDLRAKFNSSKDAKERAKLFVYLNRHCFNGLSRYNRSGEYNVPHGKYTAPACPSEAMRQFKANFETKNVNFMNASVFDTKLYKDLCENDVVYFDPPYVPLSATSNFTDYATEGFSMAQQKQLAELAESLSERGIKVIVSNHDVQATRDLYKKAEIHELNVVRTIAAKGTNRKKAKEILAVFKNSKE